MWELQENYNKCINVFIRHYKRSHMTILWMHTVLVQFKNKLSNKLLSNIISVGLWQFQSVPNVPSIHNAEGYDQRHHAWPWLYGGVSWSWSIARGAQVNEDCLLFRSWRWGAWDWVWIFLKYLFVMPFSAKDSTAKWKRLICVRNNFTNQFYLYI